MLSTRSWHGGSQCKVLITPAAVAAVGSRAVPDACPARLTAAPPWPSLFQPCCAALPPLPCRRERGHERLGQCALALRLVVAKALRRLGRLDEAEVHFKVLAGRENHDQEWQWRPRWKVCPVLQFGAAGGRAAEGE